jgi:hypothetical protein
VKLRQYLRPTLLGLLLILVDAFILNQGVLAGLVVLVQLVRGVPGIIRADSPDIKRVRLVSVAIYMGAALIVFSSNFVNNRIARHRAEVLISLIKAYVSAEHKYPEKLQDLVPGYIPSVPDAKFSLMFDKFYYSSKRPFLMYVSFPPFARPTYSFDKEAWQVLD